MPSLLRRNLRFTLLVPGTVGVVLPLGIAWFTQPVWTRPGGLRWVGLAPLALGAAVYVWTVWSFATRGRGTPGPWDPPRHLVAIGPYRVSRNPMYVGVLCVIVGEAVLTESWWVAAYGGLVALMFNLFIRLYEEPTLSRRFGEEWAAYRRRVPRWIGRPRRQA